MRRLVFCFLLISLIALVASSIAFAAEKERVLKPDDKLVTQRDEIIVEKSNGETYTVKLKNIGKNSVVVTIKDEEGAEKPVLRRVVRIPLFKDVPDDYWAKQAIEISAAAGLIGTARDVYFRPEETIARDKFAKMIATALKVKPIAPKAAIASDLPANDANAKFVNYAVNIRKLMDLEGGAFRPKDKITKAEAIVAFCRLEGLTQNWGVTENPFDDMPPRHRYIRWISTAKEAGLLKFAEDRGFLDPDGALTNAEFATLISKTKVGKKATTDLLNWDIGFSISRAVK